MGPFHSAGCGPVPEILHELDILRVFHRTGIFLVAIDVFVKVRKIEI
jgi:hypothetical protein